MAGVDLRFEAAERPWTLGAAGAVITNTRHNTRAVEYFLQPAECKCVVVDLKIEPERPLFETRPNADHLAPPGADCLDVQLEAKLLHLCCLLIEGSCNSFNACSEDAPERRTCVELGIRVVEEQFVGDELLGSHTLVKVQPATSVLEGCLDVGLWQHNVIVVDVEALLPAIRNTAIVVGDLIVAAIDERVAVQEEGRVPRDANVE